MKKKIKSAAKLPKDSKPSKYKRERLDFSMRLKFAPMFYVNGKKSRLHGMGDVKVSIDHDGLASKESLDAFFKMVADAIFGEPVKKNR